MDISREILQFLHYHPLSSRDDVDERQLQTSFNFELIREQLPAVRLFTDEERARLQELQAEFRQHISEMTVVIC